MVEPRILGARYRIVSIVRRGGMGAVYRAHDQRRQVDVALKEMRADVVDAYDEMLRRFQREAIVLEKLRHSNIPRFLDHFVESGSQCLVMEFIEGDSLDRLVAQREAGGLPQKVALEYALQVCGILRYLHEDPHHPILHRDVKPSNLILRHGKDVVLVDFGLAKGAFTTGSGTAAGGTLGYASTEQLQGEPEVRSDVYALGATLYHLLTGKQPVPLRPCTPRADNPHIDAAIAEVVERATQKLPQDRFASAADMEAALRRAKLSLEPARAAAATVPRPPPPPRPASTSARPGKTVSEDTLARVRKATRDLPTTLRARVARALQPKPSARDLAVFTRQLEVMLVAGINLMKALAILRTQNASTPLYRPVENIYVAVAKGKTIAGAFARETRIFGDMYVAMLRAAEEHGALPQALNQLGNYAERDHALRARVRGAMMYPLFVLVFTCLLTYVTVMFAVPPFIGVLTGLNMKLPFVTRVLIQVVTIGRNSYAMAAIAVLALTSGHILRGLMKQKHARAAIDSIVLDLPIAGRLARNLALARISRCLSTMLRAGLMIDTCVLHASEVSLNAAYSRSLLTVRERLREGATLQRALEEDVEVEYPRLFVGLVAAGEEAGDLDVLLERAANLYEQDVSHEVDVIVTLLEPLLMAFTATIVGCILVALFLPILSVVQGLM